MSLFITDKVANPNLLEQNNNTKRYKPIKRLTLRTKKLTNNEEINDIDDGENDFGGLPPPSSDISHIIKPYRDADSKRKDPTSGLGAFDLHWQDTRNSSSTTASSNATTIEDVNHFVTKNIESKQTDLSKFSTSERKLKKLGKVERSKSAGVGWYNIPATEVTEEVKNNLEIIKMRSALDPKHFYKRSESKGLPKFFQIGKVIESPLDFYNERDVKKTKSKSLVDELLQDAEFQKFNKRKYQEAVKSKKSTGYNKAHAKMKKLKKK